VSTAPDRPTPPLTDELSEEIGNHLQLTLVELIALSLAAKQLHWTAYGREFLSLHRHLDHLVDEWRDLEDVVAERAAAIGIAPDAEVLGALDLVSQDVLTGVARKLEEQLWMMQAQLTD
jgi:starvation-inducible DNA-binding protein